MNSDKWIDEHADYLYRFAFSRLNSHSDAEDVVQEALISAWQNRDRFQGKASERTWLTSILKNKVIDRFRRRAKESGQIDDSVDLAQLNAQFDDQGHSIIAADKWFGSPADAASKAEFWMVFDACVSKLPERTGSVFVMRELDQLASEEICKVLEITASNYWVRLHRARLKLRDCLEINWFQHEESNQE